MLTMNYCHICTPVYSTSRFDIYGSNRRAGFILLDDLMCNGQELTLEDCGYSNDTTDCTRQEDISVMCQGI